MVKTPSLGVRVQPEVKAALEKAAEEDMRSLSSMIEKILIEYLRAHGRLAAQPKAKAARNTRAKS
jgi:hypothetical protein